MASFLRKIVAKSRSKSPVKRPSANGHAYTGLNHADEEFHHWSPSASPERSRKGRRPHPPSLPYATPPQIRRLPTYPHGSDVFVGVSHDFIRCFCFLILDDRCQIVFWGCAKPRDLQLDNNEVGVFSYEPHSADRPIASSSAVPGSMASLRNDAATLSPGTWQSLTPGPHRKAYGSSAEVRHIETKLRECVSFSWSTRISGTMSFRTVATTICSLISTRNWILIGQTRVPASAHFQL